METSHLDVIWSVLNERAQFRNCLSLALNIHTCKSVYNPIRKLFTKRGKIHGLAISEKRASRIIDHFVNNAFTRAREQERCVFELLHLSAQGRFKPTVIFKLGNSLKFIDRYHSRISKTLKSQEHVLNGVLDVFLVGRKFRAERKGRLACRRINIGSEFWPKLGNAADPVFKLISPSLF